MSDKGDICPTIFICLCVTVIVRRIFVFYKENMKIVVCNKSSDGKFGF